MRSFYQVQKLCFTKNVFSKNNRNSHFLVFFQVLFNDFTEANDRTVAIRNFNSYCAFTRNRSHDTST